MNDDTRAPKVTRVLHDLKHNAALRQESVAGVALDPQIALLRVWQSQRLCQTYADLLADQHTSPACRFFLSDIYAPRDFSQRNHDVERIYAFLTRVMPPQTLQLLSDVIALNQMTTLLDDALRRALVDQLGITDSITPEAYAEGYRICANYAERVQQIDRITSVLGQVGMWAHRGVVGLALKLVGGPARQAGWLELYDFLSRGYDAFKRLRDVTTFVETIDQRERRILDQIFSGSPAPFLV